MLVRQYSRLLHPGHDVELLAERLAGETVHGEVDDVVDHGELLQHTGPDRQRLLKCGARHYAEERFHKLRLFSRTFCDVFNVT